MLIMILIALGVCFSLSILFLVLYIKMKKKYSKTEATLQKTIELFNNFKKELALYNRKGYYEYTMNLMTIEDYKNGLKGEPYVCYLYVIELDKYTNGMSKIELTNIELLSGFDSSQFEYVKNIVKNKFSSLRKTSDINWLESEDKIKELRKQKLKKISELNN